MKDFAIPLPALIDLEKKRFIGHVEIRFENEVDTAKFVAEPSYQRELGARSLTQAVEQLIETLLVDEYV